MLPCTYNPRTWGKGNLYMSRRCIIFGAGDTVDIPPEIRAGAFVIAADGGYESLAAQGIRPDLLVGDFDSLETVPDNVETLRYPAEKDDTDMELAVEYAAERGFDEIFLFGASGGRTDHTIANIQLLISLSRKGIKACIFGINELFFAVTDGTLEIREAPGTIVSVFCMGETALGVTLTGMKYPLDNALLTHEKPLGVSNILTEESGKITVKKGTLLAVVVRE